MSTIPITYLPVSGCSFFFQTSAVEKLRTTVKSLEKDVQMSADANASLQKTLLQQQENELQSTLKVQRITVHHP